MRLLTALLIGLSAVSATTVQGADCICVAVPMFEGPGGWFHYAIVSTPPAMVGGMCTQQYPTGLFNEQQLDPQTCGFNCGECFSLGGVGTVLPDDFHFRGLKKPFSALDEENEIKAYLRLISDSEIPHYDNWRFALHGTLRLTRIVNNVTETFHVVVHTMTNRDGRVGHLGVEISDPTGSNPIVPRSYCNAVTAVQTAAMTTETKLVPGILQIEIAPNVVAFVRLHDISNRDAQYVQCRGSGIVESPLNPSLSANIPFVGCGTVSNLYCPQRSYDCGMARHTTCRPAQAWCCKPRKVHSRKCCR